MFFRRLAAVAACLMTPFNTAYAADADGNNTDCVAYVAIAFVYLIFIVAGVVIWKALSKDPDWTLGKALSDTDQIHGESNVLPVDPKAGADADQQQAELTNGTGNGGGGKTSAAPAGALVS